MRFVRIGLKAIVVLWWLAYFAVFVMWTTDFCQWQDAMGAGR